VPAEAAIPQVVGLRLNMRRRTALLVGRAMNERRRKEGRLAPSNASFVHGRVVHYDKYAPTPDMEWIDSGLGVRALGARDDRPGRAGSCARLLTTCRARSTGRLRSDPTLEIGTTDALRETERLIAGG
jgi:hypothetical protein